VAIRILFMSVIKRAPRGVRIATPVCALVRNDIFEKFEENKSYGTV